MVSIYSHVVPGLQEAAAKSFDVILNRSSDDSERVAMR